MRLLGIDHVVIRARDPVALERFYVEVLGCAVERRQDNVGLVQLRAGAQLIDLVDVTGGWAGWAAPRRAPRPTTWTTCACG
jgi:glyoxylase I family protein